jgi:hypothetical protein
MTTTPAQTATSARNFQLDNIDRLIAQLTADAAALRTKTADFASNDWRYAGRGGDLEYVEQNLEHAVAALAAVAR